MFCTIDISNEILVFQSFLHHQINLSTKNLFQGFLKIEVVCNIIPFLMVGGIEIDKQIHIALVVESIGKDRPKDCQGLDPILTAQVKNALQIQFNQLHIRKYSDSFQHLNTSTRNIVENQHLPLRFNLTLSPFSPCGLTHGLTCGYAEIEVVNTLIISM